MILLWCLLTAAFAGPPEDVKLMREWTSVFSPTTRMTFVSHPLLDAPYQTDPLGEAQAPDPDPLVRFDVFDCLTFVEEVIAQSLGHTDEEVNHLRMVLRYGDGPIDYNNRHHFMELQWIPNALQAGLLVETTADYGDPIRVERQVTSQTWASWPQRNQFAIAPENLPTGPMALNVLPLDEAIAAADQFPPGAILMIVREDRTYKPLWITHLGFVTIYGTFRHASRMKSAMRVRDNTIAGYLRLLTGYTNWPVLGVSVFELPEDRLP